MKMFVRGSVDGSDIGPVLPHIEVAHRNVTIELKPRWLTPAGLCVSTQKNQRDCELVVRTDCLNA